MNVPVTKRALDGALEGLVRIQGAILTQRVPLLYQSGVRYQRELGTEHWQTVQETLKKGYGDCEDLASWRAAELRRRGVPASAVAVRTGPRRYHAVVLWPDGRIEDPSKKLGMGQA